LTDLSDEDIDRLAARVAMMVSEDGEAENAGRAVAQLARRLGLTGGDLKELFLTGARPGTRSTRKRTADVERLEREITALRKGLRMVENNCRAVERERDALIVELETLREAKATKGSSSRLWLVMLVLVVVAGGITAALSLLLPGVEERAVLPARAAPTVQGSGGAPAGAPDERRAGLVRAAHAPVYQQPDRSTPVLVTLQAGMPLVVRRVFWNLLIQWAEVDVGSGTGYVLTTDIDLS
jgi:hypothetical protein